MERLSDGVSTVIQLWQPINIITLEDGDDTFPETLVRTRATRYTVLEGISDTAVKGSLRTVFLDD
jgi:hypothetical protein